jgi:predicted NBD/HSP70 family sugar kinase
LAIVRAAKKSIPGLSDLTGKSADRVSVEDNFALAKRGGVEAIRITDDVVTCVGICLVNLINIMGPELMNLTADGYTVPAGRGTSVFWC